MAYTNPNYVNGQPPALNADNMNAIANNLEMLTPVNGGTGLTSTSEQDNTLFAGSILMGGTSDKLGQISGTGALYATTNRNPRMGTLPVSCGGTGATSLSTLKTNMGLAKCGFQISTTPITDTSKLWIKKSTTTPVSYTMYVYDAPDGQAYNAQYWYPILGVFGA